MHPLTPANLNPLLVQRISQALYRCLEEVGSTKGALYLVIPEEQSFCLVSHYGWPWGSAPPERLSCEDPLVVWAQRERRTFAVNEGQDSPELAAFCEGSASPRFLITPVNDKGDWVALLVQRDPAKGRPFDVEWDEPPTLAICEEIVALQRALQGYLAPQVESEPSPFPPAGPTPAAMPVEVPPSTAMLPGTAVEVPQQNEALEGFKASGGDHTFSSLNPTRAMGGLKLEDTGEAVQAGPGPRRKRSGGMFLPEQRTFFWEAANLLCRLMPLSAVALWMDEPGEIRPILTYSPCPLSSDLKQQIMAHATFHASAVEQKDLRILTRVEWLEGSPIHGLFLTYLPVILMEEGGGQDLLMLFRMQDQPFDEREQELIQQVSRMLGFHLQECRLHERYHRAFLSVSYRILLSAENKAPTLRPHSLTAAKLARHLALRLELPGAVVEAVSLAAILHDVGILLLDPHLMDKPQLTEQEMAKVRTHPVLAATVLKGLRFPFDILEIIRHHHERWDGAGYPDGLAGEAIPMGSRIINLVEAFEVMSSGRSYSKPMTLPNILDELNREAGKQFDPALVPEFIQILTKVRT